MVPDEQVIVLGGGGAPVEPRPPDRRRSPLWILVPVLGVFVALIAFVVVPQEETPTTAEPGDLQAPAEPPQAFVSTTVTAPLDVPPLALGWREARLLGAGWTVSSVDHGVDGWLAVSVQPPVVAHVSENAVLWEAHTIHDLAVEEPVAAVGDGLMAVFGTNHSSPADGPRPVGAISVDRGETWLSVSYDGLLVVSDIQIVDGRILVAGSTGGSPGFGWEGRGIAALWEVVDGELVDLGIDGGENSGLNALAAVRDKVMAFGHTETGAAMWVVDRPAASVVPAIGAGRTFIDVENTGDGLVAVVGFAGSGLGGGSELWESVDGSAWTSAGRINPPNVTSLTSTGDGLLASTWDPGRMWLEDVGNVWSSYRGYETGWESAGPVTDIEVADDVMVMAASGEAGGQLYVRGTLVTPVEIVPSLEAAEPRWRTVASVDLEGGWGPYAYPFGVATDGQATFVATPGLLFDIAEVNEQVVLSPSVIGVTNLGSGPAGVWAAVAGAETQLYEYGSDGVWSSERVPVQEIASVGVLDGARAVTSWDADGFVLLRQQPDGSWEEANVAPDGSDNFWMTFVGGGLMGQRDRLEDGIYISDLVASTDGSEWSVLEGWTFGGTGPGGSAYLAKRTDPSVIGIVDSLPVVREFEIPVFAAAPRIIERWDDRLIVQGDSTLHYETVDGEWMRAPFDLEHGISGQAVVIPGPTLRVALLSYDGLRILEWG